MVINSLTNMLNLSAAVGAAISVAICTVGLYLASKRGEKWWSAAYCLIAMISTFIGGVSLTFVSNQV